MESMKRAWHNERGIIQSAWVSRRFIFRRLTCRNATPRAPMSSITLRRTRARLFSSFTTSRFACRSTTASRLLASDLPASAAIKRAWHDQRGMIRRAWHNPWCVAPHHATHVAWWRSRHATGLWPVTSELSLSSEATGVLEFHFHEC